MATFRPKAVFEQAQAEEQKGNLRLAASHYASVGLYLRRKGKLREARRLLLKAINLHPSSARLYLHLAGVEASLGSGGQAGTAMRAFVSTAGVRGKLREYETQVSELMEKHPSLAVIYYLKWLETDRTEPRVLILASHLTERCEELEPALRLLREAFELAPNDRRVREAVRGFLERQLDTVRLHAWEGFEAGRLNKEQMLSVLGDSSLPLDQHVDVEAEPSQSRGQSFTLDKSLSSMIASLEQQLGELGGTVPKEDEQISDIKPLITEFRRNADQILKNDDGSRWDMAHAFAEMGLNDEAVEELKKIAPDSEWYLKGLLKQAEILFEQQSLLGALDCLQRVIRTDTSKSSAHVEALYQAAHVYFQLMDFEQALRCLQLLEKASPQYRESRSLKMRVEEAMQKSRTGT